MVTRNTGRAPTGAEVFLHETQPQSPGVGVVSNTRAGVRVAARSLRGFFSSWGFGLVVLVIVLGSPATVAGESYFVANDGDDQSTGTAPDEAWQTLAKVSDSTFQPGDSILLKRGDDWYEALMIPSSGTPANPIIFGSYGTGALPRILGSIRLSGGATWSATSGSVSIRPATRLEAPPTTDPSRGPAAIPGVRGSRNSMAA